MQAVATQIIFIALFNGHNFDGWEGNLDIFRIENGAIVAGSMDKPVPPQ